MICKPLCVYPHILLPWSCLSSLTVFWPCPEPIISVLHIFWLKSLVLTNETFDCNILELCLNRAEIRVLCLALEAF